MAKQRLCVAVDMDSTICDLHANWFPRYNDEFGDNLTIEGVTSFDTHHFAKAGHKVFKYFSEPGFFAPLQPYEGALEALRALHDDGHEIHILSSATAGPDAPKDKFVWCRERLPWLSKRKINFVYQKSRFLCDVLIDDSPENTREHARLQPSAKRAGIAFPYNEGAPYDLRAESWKDTAKAWEQILAFVRGLASE